MSDHHMLDNDVKLSTEGMQRLSSADTHSDRSSTADGAMLTPKSESDTRSTSRKRSSQPRASGDRSSPRARRPRIDSDDDDDDEEDYRGRDDDRRHRSKRRDSGSRRDDRSSRHPRVKCPSPDSRSDAERSRRRRRDSDPDDDERRDHHRNHHHERDRRSPRHSDDHQERFTLFFTKKFVFSNHYLCPNLRIEDRDFACTEQYYMFIKARTFHDEETAEEIMKTHDPREMKMLGSRVKNFIQDDWNAPGRYAMTLANYRKYQQNKDFRHALFMTHGTTLVECNPTDRRWGIGLAMDDPNARQRSRWRGTNWLGQILTKVRDRLWEDPLYADEVREVKRLLDRRDGSSFR